MSFRLYQSEGCHLCEEAKLILQQSQMIHLGCELIDIAYDEALINRFGEKIPVLEHIGSRQWLCWPFELDQLNNWLKQL